MATDAIIALAELEPHFEVVESAAREQQLLREGLLDDPRQRTTLLAHLLLDSFSHRLTNQYSPLALFWTKHYWQRRVRRMHERLEHEGGSCPAFENSEDYLHEDIEEVGADWDQLEGIEARALADADADLGAGPFLRPRFACGDIRPLPRTPGD